jgi:mannose-6-phosphate isomerase
MITELQEPTSFSILAEYEPFGLDEDQATLGLGWELALGCFDLHGRSSEELGRLAPTPTESPAGDGWSAEQLFPDEAARFFQAHRVRVTGAWSLGEGGFRILVIERGEGELAGLFGHEPIRHGETWLLPASAHGVELVGEAEILVCAPGGDDRPGSPGEQSPHD